MTHRQGLGVLRASGVAQCLPHLLIQAFGFLQLAQVVQDKGQVVARGSRVEFVGVTLRPQRQNLLEALAGLPIKPLRLQVAGRQFACVGTRLALGWTERGVLRLEDVCEIEGMGRQDPPHGPRLRILRRYAHLLQLQHPLHQGDDGAGLTPASGEVTDQGMQPHAKWSFMPGGDLIQF